MIIPLQCDGCGKRYTPLSILSIDLRLDGYTIVELCASCYPKEKDNIPAGKYTFI